MNAFAAAVNGIFADPNMAADAVWRPAGGADVAIRLVITAPDIDADFLSSRARAVSRVGEIRVTDAPTLANGDMILVGGQSYTVQNRRQDDELRLTWKVDLL